VWTARLNEACQAVGVELLDHLLIAGPKAWVSIREKGWPTPAGPATAEPLAAGVRWERARCLGNATGWSVRCRRCAGFVELKGQLGPSWGACAMAGSPFDGRLVYEGDGCGAFSPVAVPAAAVVEAGGGRGPGGGVGRARRVAPWD
jgi:hypothetical protein